MNRQPTNPTARRIISDAALFAGAALLSGTALCATTASPIPISQVPLTVAIPAHPQVLFALANSQSMDGTLSGAILTGSGSLASGLAGLNASSSPLNYTVPAGFTAPVSSTTAGNSAPYTVSQSGVLYDNANSRLNVAKGGITSILNTFLPNADFGLIDFKTSGLSQYTTWVYYMSPSGSGFTFTNSPAGSRYVVNPCYGIPLDSTNTLDSNCKTLEGRYSNIDTYQYMLIGASSDDPSINDVLYASGLSAVCVAFGGPSPATPYPPNRTLSQYESGSITESYSSSKPSSCATATGPTNAGFVPYSQEVMYAQRGFGFYTSGETADPGTSTSWAPLVTMTSAGQVPTQTSVDAALAQFAPYLAPETNSTSTTEIKASATQSPIAGLLKAAKNYFQSANPASSNGCTATRYVVLVTDGLPTKDLSGKNWPPLGSAAAAGYSVTATFKTDGSLDTTNDQALTDTITALAALNSAGIKTYIIGLGAGVDPTANPSAAATLTAMAVAGGSGSYFAATTEEQLNDDMQVILGKILAATQSTASTAVNSTGLHRGDVAYLAKFTTADTYQDWTGDLAAYPIDPTTGAVDTSSGSADWSAQAQLDAESWDSGRIIATWDPVAAAGTPFRWTSGTPTTGIASSTTLGSELSTFYGDGNGQDVLNYLRGNIAQEQRNGGAFRNRAHVLGDIVSSAPLYVGPPQGVFQTTTYRTFMANHKNRAPILYIGANDGMLHAFDAATGAERFAYIPNGVFANLVSLANPYYNEQHQFYVNGSPRSADVQYADQSWHTILVGNEGAGGKSLFALDVTNADSVTTESQLAAAAMWEFTDTDMGYSFSEPAIAKTSAGWLVFTGNGYDSTNEKPFLYALDAHTGATTAKIDLCAAVASACDSSVANGLSSVTAVNSYGLLAQPADTIYAGDLQGNVWRVDIRDSNPTNWAVTVIFQAKDSSGSRQPITTAPAVALNPHYPRIVGDMVYIATGQLLGLTDLSTTQAQTLYGVFDPPPGSSPPLGFSGIPARSNLAQQTMQSATINGVSVRVEGTVSSVDIPTDRGWYIDFNLAAGERFVTDPQVEEGAALVVTSYQPNTSSCDGGGNAWLTVVNDGTGGSFALPQLDVDSSGALDSNDQTTSGSNPVGVTLGSVYASEPTILSTSNSNAGAVKLTAESNTTIQSITERGGPGGRIGWFEVRQ